MQHTPDQQFPGSGSNQPEPAKNGLCRAWVVLVCILAVLAVGMSALVLHVYLSGKNIRRSNAAPKLETLAPAAQTGETAEKTTESSLRDDSTVLVNGTHYRFNDEIQTFLLLGIDSHIPAYTDGSCNVHAFSDAIMLAAMDFVDCHFARYNVRISGPEPRRDGRRPCLRSAGTVIFLWRR